jgi:hypothetical protein
MKICFFIGDSNMRNKLGKITLAIGFGLALAFTLSCSSDSPSGPSGGESSPSYKPSSSSVYTPPPPPSSSSIGISSSSSNPREKMFYGEIGTVCVGYTNLFSLPLDNRYFIADGTDNFVNMYSVCGDKAQSFITGTQAEGVSWLNARNISDAMFNAINQELFIKGNSAFLGFYPAVDGYLRYLYIEELNDGKGLAKILATEEK